MLGNTDSWGSASCCCDHTCFQLQRVWLPGTHCRERCSTRAQAVASTSGRNSKKLSAEKNGSEWAHRLQRPKRPAMDNAPASELAAAVAESTKRGEDELDGLSHIPAHDRKGSSFVQAPLTDDEPIQATPDDTESEEGSDQDTGWRFRRKKQLTRGQRILIANNNALEPKIPTFTAKEERQGARPGFYTDALAAARILFPVSKERMRENQFIANSLLLRVQSWRAALWIIRDLRHFFDRVAISTAFHKVAKLAHKQRASIAEIHLEEGYPILVKAVRKHFKLMTPRAKANVVWSVATIRENGMNGLFDFFLDVIEEEGFSDAWKYQELSNVAWAVASMNRRRVKLLTNLAEEVLKRQPALFAPQAISNISWSLATLNFAAYAGEQHLRELRHSCFMALADASYLRLSEFAPQAISNTIWSFANVGISHMRLTRAVVEQLAVRAEQYSNQEISNTLIALAKLEVEMDPRMVKAVEAVITRPDRFAQMKNQVLANVLWALATVRFYSQAIMDAFRDELIDRMPSLQFKEVSNIMWAFSKLGYHPQADLLLVFNDFVEHNLKSLNAQATSNMIWAIGVLQATHLSCFQKLIDHLGTMDIQDVDIVQLHQLFQALLLADLERQFNPTSQQLTVPKEVLELITRVWKKLAQETSSSNFQKDVSARLKEMGIEHVEEFLAEEGLFSIDIAFSGPNGMRVAMEVDGPFHYTCNTNQPMGHTLLRHRLLRALGWTVIPIPYFEYYPMDKPQEKMEYIARKLYDVGIRVSLESIQHAVNSMQAAPQEVARAQAHHSTPEQSHLENGSNSNGTNGINGDSASRSGLMEKPVLKNPLAKQRKPLRPQRPQEQDSKSS